jgi:hypothetical protein
MADLNDILGGIVDPGHGGLPPELARYVLSLRFSDEQAARYEQLAYQNQDASLTAEQRVELEAFVTANTFLSILKSKARRSLSERPSAA